MRGIAEFLVHGRIGNDPEYTQLSNGTNRVRVSVCANIPKRVDNEWTYDPVWFNIAWFGEAADGIVNKLRKGLPIVVRGDITTYKQNINGQEVTRYNFRPRTASIIDEEERLRRRDQSQQQYQQQSPRQQQQPPPQQQQPNQNAGRQPAPQPQPAQQPAPQQAARQPAPQPQPQPQTRQPAPQQPPPDGFDDGFGGDAFSDDDIPF